MQFSSSVTFTTVAKETVNVKVALVKCPKIPPGKIFPPLAELNPGEMSRLLEVVTL